MLLAGLVCFEFSATNKV